MTKTETMKEFQDEMLKETFGEDAKGNWQRGLCIECKLPAIPRCYSEAGKKEFAISGLCEVCFDKIFE